MSYLLIPAIYAIDPKGRVHTFCCAVPGAWHVMGVTQAAGYSLAWYQDNMGASYVQEAKEKGCGVFDLINADVLKTPIGANRLIYLPYLNGERTPHLDANCRGVFFGLVQHAHTCRPCPCCHGGYQLLS